MVFSHKSFRAGVLVASLFAGCAFGRGEGELSGVFEAEDCDKQGEYSMNPNFFAAEPIEELLVVRVQRGSSRDELVDGLLVLIRNAAELQRDLLGQSIEIVDDDDALVQITLSLGKTCPPTRDRTAVVLPAVSGAIAFESIYAPEGDSPDVVEVAAELTDVLFADPRDDTRRAQLSGHFRFLFERGSPAQPFP